MAQKPQFQVLGEAFVGHYYNNFDANRANLMGLYRDSSMLTFEGEQHMGAQQIVKKLVELPFQKVIHQIGTIDCQPTNANPNGIIVFVSGNLAVDDSEHPLKFSQTFHLMPDQGNPGQFWVHNDLFRLNYG
mmetsp:Transcript_12491/g.27256  ORF Transcript_12491/g.27256 Transcript_12491/m.27256 type:complete len:131 (+) Transcript_12491:97-489(+)|eukprot:CAMPEP_0185844704 /NCGR_PEP_ID=MMETSP1354-20130828/829_1 /TAXON_ID=708628 /ORGANISM="Erythrolobus madagascarensis, Strain CCMP3276" /LENGTH=130 /DNA_ID=CAMNT_0028544461 /DNA_START=12 /DNA_END=400 /DNA_ORIENTATION=+